MTRDEALIWWAVTYGEELASGELFNWGTPDREQFQLLYSNVEGRDEWLERVDLGDPDYWHFRLNYRGKQRLKELGHE
jgi:hypothetical protein